MKNVSLWWEVQCLICSVYSWFCVWLNIYIYVCLHYLNICVCIRIGKHIYKYIYACVCIYFSFILLQKLCLSIRKEGCLFIFFCHLHSGRGEPSEKRGRHLSWEWDLFPGVVLEAVKGGKTEIYAGWAGRLRSKGAGCSEEGEESHIQTLGLTESRIFFMTRGVAWNLCSFMSKTILPLWKAMMEKTKNQPRRT